MLYEVITVRRRRKKLSSGTLPPAKEKTVRTKSEPTATTTAPKAKMAAKGASDKAPAKPQKEKAEKTTAD